MATAREAHMRRMARLMEIGRMHMDGKTSKQIAEHYGVSKSYVYMLLKQFERYTTPNRNKLSRYMRDEEAKELMHIKDWLEFLTKEPQ